MIWKFITFFVRKLDPEIAHKLTIKSLKLGLHPRLKQSVIQINIGNLIFKNLKSDKDQIFCGNNLIDVFTFEEELPNNRKYQTTYVKNFSFKKVIFLY